MDLYKPKEIFGVMIQGRSQIQQWVTKFKVQYGDNENSLKYVEVGGKPMVGYSIISSSLKENQKL